MRQQKATPTNPIQKPGPAVNLETGGRRVSIAIEPGLPVHRIFALRKKIRFGGKAEAYRLGSQRSAAASLVLRITLTSRLCHANGDGFPPESREFLATCGAGHALYRCP
jgi:hypothetical protein